MAKDQLSSLQLRLARWQRSQGTTRVVLAISIFSVLGSVAICFPIFHITYGSFLEVGIFNLALTVATPAVIAPIASYQLATTLGMASELIDELQISQAQLEQEITKRRVIQLELENLVRIDALTGILNRRGFYERLHQTIDEHVGLLTLATIDVDFFKSVNDEHGHAAGDLVLCEVAEALQRITNAPSFIGRLGGDEFVVALVDEDPVTLHVLRSTLDPISIGPHAGLRVRCSVGAADHDPQRSIDATLALADDELYRDKSRRRSDDRPRRGMRDPRGVPDAGAGPLDVLDQRPHVFHERRSSGVDDDAPVDDHRVDAVPG
jgi:diguanylate cyclase (GGDEF)-like protein